ncbi:MAG TPA: hypothetical protein VJ822_16300 [Dongiaceae bacterium]|nr:hypothetical protein [Dongiaceae bacterium]
MDFTLALWLNRLYSTATGAVPGPQPSDCKPLEIEVERLPDYLWRDLGFPQPRPPEAE